MKIYSQNLDFLAKLVSSEIYQEAKSCITLAIPLSLAQLIEVSLLTVDTWAMGKLGTETLAGGAFGCVTFSFFFNIGIFIISAVNTVAAIAFGKKQLTKLGPIVGQGFYLALLIALPMMAILGASSTWIAFLSQDNAIISPAKSYLQAILWGLPALFGYEVLRNVLTAINRPKVITAIAISSIFLNAGVNYILAFGKFGAPALGLAGIGWATVIVLWFQILFALSFICLNPDFKDYQLFRQCLKFNAPVFQEIFQLGLPIGIQYISAGSFNIVLVYFFGYFGAVSLAAFQIATQVGNIIRNIVLGVAQATVARVGQMYGEQSSQGVRRAGFVGMTLAIFITIVTLVIVAGESAPIVNAFLTPKKPTDMEVFQLACIFSVIIALHQVINGIETTATAALRGIKDTTIPMLIGLFSYWIFGISSIYLLSFYWHLQGVGLLISCSLSVLTTTIGFPLRFYFKTSESALESKFRE